MNSADSENLGNSVEEEGRQEREISNRASGSALVSSVAERSVEMMLKEHSILRHVLACMPVGFCMFDRHDRLQWCNQQYVDVWNLPVDVCQQGTHFDEIMRHSHGKELAFSGESLGKVGQKRREWLTDDGRRIDVLVHVLAEGTVLALHEDVTEKREAEQRIAHLASFDVLTNLHNRAMLHQRLKETLASNDQYDAALLYLDLNGFKLVNDTLGHPVGDKLLVEVATRIKFRCREPIMVARIGGDEFAIVMTDLQSMKCAETLSKRIIETLSEPFTIDGKEIYSSTSIGIASITDDCATVEEIVQRADLALYEAKAVGGGVFRVYDEAIACSSRMRRTLETDLNRAIQNDEFELYYQAQIDAKTMEICGAEALIRWNHPTRGQVMPDEFIPVAEKTGLIIEIGRWVLDTACREALYWPDCIKVAVNVSTVQFGNAGMPGVDLLREVTLALRNSGLPTNRLELEMTETVIMEDVNKTRAVLHDLKSLGVSIAIDDFGTGYSSLRYLHSFQFDNLKIDRSFVTDIENDVDVLSIAQTIVALGRNLGISSTAEGVETQAELEVIRQLRCNKIQGYYFSRPCSATDFRAFTASYSGHQKLLALSAA